MIKNSTIKVAVKVKPFLHKNLSINPVHALYNQQQIPTLKLNFPNQNQKHFLIDALHDANTSNQTTFKDLHIDRLVSKFIQGFNVTILAYGQTGAGKTFAMQGNQKQPGIITQSINMLYERLNQKKNSKLSQNKLLNTLINSKSKAFISCSYLQLYNQKLQDLLSQQKNYQQGLKLRWEAQKEFSVQDLVYKSQSSAQSMLKTWKKGNKRKIMSSNQYHETSSRSHTLFTIVLSDQDQQGNSRTRQMVFVDLAGSQRIFNIENKINRQSVQINKSLFVLRKVIKLLEQTSEQKKNNFIPYRDSKLTSLLKKSLGGNCLTMMIACIDPKVQQKQETLLTLNYAISAGRIKNAARISIDPLMFENKQLKLENQKLKKQLQIAWGQLNVFQKQNKNELQKNYMAEYSHKIIQCIGTIRQLIKSNKQLREQIDQERSIRKKQQLQLQMLLQQRMMTKRYHSVKQQINSSSIIFPKTPKKSLVLETPTKVISAEETISKMTCSLKNTAKFSIKKSKEPLRKNRESILKRKNFVIHKTQPDQD